MITNQIIADFLKCRQRAFLSLTNKTDTPTGFELHQQRIVKRLMDRFTIVNESRILKNCTFHGVIPSDISSQVYVINPSVTSNTCRLTLDAITILPSASGTSKLTCVPIMASSNVVVSKIDRLTLCIISLILQKQIPHFKLLHCTIISEWNAPTTFSLETYIREARHHLQQLLTMNEQPTQQRFYKNDHCETCPNKATCMQELISKDDMSLLGSMS